MEKTIINPPTLAPAVGFSHGIIVTGGRLLFLAGQTGSNAEGQIIAPGDLYASKMIMRPERESKEHRDPCPEQRDCQYGEGPLQETEPVPENAAPHR